MKNHRRRNATVNYNFLPLSSSTFRLNNFLEQLDISPSRSSWRNFFLVSHSISHILITMTGFLLDPININNRALKTFLSSHFVSLEIYLLLLFALTLIYGHTRCVWKKVLFRLSRIINVNMAPLWSIKRISRYSL